MLEKETSEIKQNAGDVVEAAAQSDMALRHLLTRGFGWDYDQVGVKFPGCPADASGRGSRANYGYSSWPSLA